MKNFITTFTVTATSALVLTGLNVGLPQAQSVNSSAPTPPALLEIVDRNPQPWYIDTTSTGIQFYGADPFYSQKTSDGNLFVSGVVLMGDRDTVHGSYIQINCGGGTYRDLIPYLIITSDGYEYQQQPQTYNWKYVAEGSVFETVAAKYCLNAIADRR